MSNEKPKLSRRQKTILDFIRQTILDRGWPPSIREIGEAVGLSSSSTVFSHLKALEAKGYLRRNPSTPRSIILLDPKPTPTAAEERVTELEALLEQFEFCYAGECAWCNEHEELWRDDMGWQHIPGCPWGQAADNHRARVAEVPS